MKKSVLLHSSSDEETINIGIDLGTVLTEGDVIALVGELGSGKTWLTKGLALGLGVSPDTIITSPSFSLMNEYAGRCTLFHMDAYRLESIWDFLSAGLDEYFFQSAVVVMEWADRWPELLPDRRLMAELTIAGYHSRKITMSGCHPRAMEILKHMAEGKEAPSPP